ncbi:MAG: glycosyltransferase family 2 protein [Chloroflexi bacterium]|nr:glycosyltransferase family 2 protein [Chloroflexota bacterium]
MIRSSDEELFLSVAITAYNEEARIGPSLAKIAAFLDSNGYLAEIVVNDDGSEDRTQEIVRSFEWPRLKLICSPKNQGKGAGIRNSVLASRGQYILFTDADLSTNIEEVEKLLKGIKDGCDIAIGCRIQPDGYDMRESQPFYRRLFGKVFHTLTWLFVIRGIADTQSGFKCFRKEAAHDLFSSTTLASIIFDVEVLYLARKRGYRIVEVPVAWTNAGGSRMRVTAGHALRVIWDLLSIPLIHRGGRGRSAIRDLESKMG